MKKEQQKQQPISNSNGGISSSDKRTAKEFQRMTRAKTMESRDDRRL
jgi:hypothetical protein